MRMDFLMATNPLLTCSDSHQKKTLFKYTPTNYHPQHNLMEKNSFTASLEHIKTAICKRIRFLEWVIIEQDKVLDANDEYARLTGHEHRDEILGRSVVEWTAAYDQENAMQRQWKNVFERVTCGILRSTMLDSWADHSRRSKRDFCHDQKQTGSFWRSAEILPSARQAEEGAKKRQRSSRSCQS